MCSTSSGNQGCCPPAQIFQESHCGNFKGKTHHDHWDTSKDSDHKMLQKMKDHPVYAEILDMEGIKKDKDKDKDNDKDKDKHKKDIHPRKIQAWKAPRKDNDFIQGTFEVFNSAQSKFPVLAVVDGEFLWVKPGNSETVSVNRPRKFIIWAFDNTDGKFCFTLYKRILA